MTQDETWMAFAIAQAEIAYSQDEVPVGAVMVHDGKLLATAHNMREAGNNPLSHAEIELIGESSRLLDTWRLSDCVMYVTLEPCLMCIGAALQARLGKLVFGCRDPKAGAVKSLYNCAEDDRLNHQIEVVEGVLADASSELLKKFFKELRSRKK